MRELGLNNSQISLRMMVSTSNNFTARLSDTGDQNFDLPQTDDMSDFFYRHDQKYIFLDHIGASKDENVLIEFLNMFPLQGETSFHDIFDEYTCKNFRERKSLAISMISTLINSQSKTKGEYVYTILDGLSDSCDEVYSIFKEVNPTRTHEVSSNLIWLHSILSDDLLVKLFNGKCDESAPFKGTIQKQSWLTRLVETNISSLISTTFKLESLIAVIKDEDEDTCGISESLINLLLDKTDNYRMIRREFFQILTSHYKNSRSSAIHYVKKYSSHTSSVTKIAVDEIKGQYDFTFIEKTTFFLSLFFTFLLSSAFHCLDVGADYSLLIESGNCR